MVGNGGRSLGDKETGKVVRRSSLPDREREWEREQTLPGSPIDRERDKAGFQSY